MNKTLLIIVCVIAGAGLGIFGWTTLQKKTAEKTTIASPTPQKTNTNDTQATPTPTATTEPEVTQNAPSAGNKETTQESKDIQALQAEVDSCKNKYGNISSCKEALGFIFAIKNCSTFTGDKMKSCAMKEMLSQSDDINYTINNSVGVTTKNGIVQNSALTVTDETDTAFTLVCVDKNTPKDATAMIVGASDISKAKKLTTLPNTDVILDNLPSCEATVDLSVMCDKVDITPFTKCQSAIAKYGKYSVGAQAATIEAKYAKLFGLQ